MTERRRPPRRPGPVWVFGGAVAAFVAALGLLAGQVRAGRDPALGAGAPIALERPRHVVIVRRIVRTTIVTRVVRPDRTPAPAPVRAPAPPSAPVTTHAS